MSSNMFNSFSISDILFANEAADYLSTLFLILKSF